MKLVCKICVENRTAAQLACKSPRLKHVQSTLALCRHPNTKEFCLIHFSSQNKTGFKYNLKDNVLRVLTKFVSAGKTTIQLKTPPHDLYIQVDDCIQLKAFLHALRKALDNRPLSDKEIPFSSMSVTAAPSVPTKMVVRDRCDYPAKGFPRTLESLTITGIPRFCFDSQILKLTRLKALDLSNNALKSLPKEINQLPSLYELDLSENSLGEIRPGLDHWEWIGGNLCTTLRQLNLNSNQLKALPNQIVKLHNLVNLDFRNNLIVSLPSGIGNMKNLSIMLGSNNRLECLPGSMKNLRLQLLDMYRNNFTRGEIRNVVPKRQLPVRTLKECSARVVMENRLLYTSETIPRTLVNYLDHEVKFCECGKACFDVFIRAYERESWRCIRTVESTVDCSECVLDSYFCSLKCYRSSRVSRVRPMVR